MEKRIYIFESDFGPIYIETEPAKSVGKIPANASKKSWVKINKRFEDAIKSVESMYKAMLAIAHKVSPDEVSIEVGVKFKAEASLFVVSTGSDIDFKVNMKWKAKTTTEINSPENLANKSGDVD